MVKKKFIDKKGSVTYSLVFRSTEDADDVPERVLVEADKGVGVGRITADAAAAVAAAHEASGRRYAPGHPLAWLEDDESSGPLSEERRREMIELGFPDDGYDYLKHTRVLGRGKANLEGLPEARPAAAAPAAAAPPPTQTAAPGPSVFMPAPEYRVPEEDLRLIDASRLTVMQAVEVEGDAAVMAGGVTAFSRDRQRVHGLEQRELAELEAAMAALEEDEDLGDAEGDGDLLDDFVLAATEYQAGEGAGPDGQGSEHGSGSEDGLSVVDSEEEEERSSYGGSGGPGFGGSQAGTRSGRPAPRAGSIASTYWRDERTDRKNLLTVIDEKFEHLALEYDDDDIGDLEEQGETIQGFADVKEFDNLLDEFLEVHGQSQAAHEGNVPYSAPRISQVAQEMELHGMDDADAAIAIQKAHEALRQAEEQAAAEEEAAAAAGGEGQPRQERIPQYLQPREQEQWDCESVLSLRSNLDNHPGRISEPSGSRRSRAPSQASTAGVGAGIIRLGRMGIPMGVLPKRGAGAAPVQQQPVQQQQQHDGDSSEEEEEAAGGAAEVLLERRKGETAEEKRERKAAVKEAKRSARQNKKELKGLFKDASVAAQRRAATAQPQAALKLPS